MEKPQLLFSGFDGPPELEPVIAHESTETGWRGLCLDGEVYEVHSQNGHPAKVPEGEIVVTSKGKTIGRRVIIDPPASIDIRTYLEKFNAAVVSYKYNDLAAALALADEAVALAPTLRARFNHAMILLASGNWREGFKEYLQLEEKPPFIRPQVEEALAAGLRMWQGENLNGKRILVLHAHGAGDTIQSLRYIPTLQSMGAEVLMRVPHELVSLAAQLGTVSTESVKLIECDYFVPILHLFGRLYVSPDSPVDAPYLTVKPDRIKKWQDKLRVGNPDRKLTGIAWSVGLPSIGDYPREAPLEQLTETLTGELHSVQVQNADEARRFGVNAHEFEDFEDCAALMLCLDEVVTVDTAAVHLAGAIGHPNVKLLLSKWASWRWVKNWYGNVKICRQTSEGNWASALAQC